MTLGPSVLIKKAYKHKNIVGEYSFGYTNLFDFICLPIKFHNRNNNYEQLSNRMKPQVVFTINQTLFDLCFHGVKTEIRFMNYTNESHYSTVG